jgi:hypothetical protein
MIPSGYKEDVVYSEIPLDGSGDLSFTRASNGTRVNFDGLVEDCPWNLAEYSEDFTNAYWTKQQSSISSNVTTAPNGTLTADKLVENTSNSTHRIFNGNAIAISTSDGTTYSFYLKSAERTRAWVRDNDIVGALFNLANGTIVSTEGTATATITSVGDGWYRCTMTRVSSNGNGRLIVYLDNGTSDSYTGDGTSGVFIWGGQLNIGATPKPYFPTTDRLNVPRLTYQNGGGGCPSLLLEKQSTNLAIESEQLNLWNGANASVTANTSVSPDGTQNADNVNITATNGYWRRNPLTFANSTSYTASIFVKKSVTTGTKTFRFYYNNNQGSPNNGAWQCVIDLTNITATTTAVGTAGTGIPTILSTNIVDYGSGWYRVEVAFTTGSAAGNSSSEIGFESNGVVVDFLAWGAQVEASSYPTSYIPTTSASATRVEDACSKTGISSLIGQTSGTLFVQWINLNNDLCNLIETYNSTSGVTGTSSILIQKSANNEFNIRVFDSLGNYSDNFTATIPLGTNKIALAYESGSAILYLNGLSIGSNSRTYVFGSIRDTISFDNRGGYARSEVVLFKTRLTNAQLASLTTI